MPTPVFQRSEKAYPMLRYPWTEARAALVALAADRPELASVQVTCVNPETGGHAENILGFYAQMLRPGQTLRLPARSPATVFHQIEGATAMTIDGSTFALEGADTCCAPGYAETVLANRSATEPSFLFLADETPLHAKLGVYESRGGPFPARPVTLLTAFAPGSGPDAMLRIHGEKLGRRWNRSVVREARPGGGSTAMDERRAAAPASVTFWQGGRGPTHGRGGLGPIVARRRFRPAELPMPVLPVDAAISVPRCRSRAAVLHLPAR